MPSIERTPIPGIPYTFTTVSDSDKYFDAKARRNFDTMHLPVVADPTWPGLRHAARMNAVIKVLSGTFLIIGVPLAIAAAKSAWIAVGIFIGIAALLPIVALTWFLIVPSVTIVFDWRTRTLGERSSTVFSFDAVRLEVAPVPYGHAVWARTESSGQRAVGFFPSELVATAYRDRLAMMLRDMRDHPSRSA